VRRLRRQLTELKKDLTRRSAGVLDDFNLHTMETDNAKNRDKLKLPAPEDKAQTVRRDSAGKARRLNWERPARRAIGMASRCRAQLARLWA